VRLVFDTPSELAPDQLFVAGWLCHTCGARWVMLRNTEGDRHYDAAEAREIAVRMLEGDESAFVCSPENTPEKIREVAEAMLRAAAVVCGLQ
jgi:hypothetical protein